ncbi:MAG TPA: endonuclease/exonuclease/phosphatase family protein [Anaeromyxobacteraceae bacterium]|nr:endonuclease/exonuclease/phosphatase family protein [Anaeromyxobacteraceae bacterium]
MRLVPVLALSLACAPPLPDPWAGERPGAFVRVATWNVHDLFDEEDRLVPPGAADEVLAPAEVEAKLDRLSAVLARLDADVVLLQEVENAALLERLADRAGYPEARLLEGADPRGIDVAALSRLPVLAYLSHLGETDAEGGPLWSRDCVELHVQAGGRRLVLVGSHLVSRITDPDGDRRAEQAARMRAIADEVALVRPDAVLLAGGDLNDEPESPALAPLLADGAYRDAAARLPPADAWTWSGHAGRARLDYLLVAGRDAGALLAAAVLGGDDVAAASDHRPLAADLWVR